MASIRTQLTNTSEDDRRVNDKVQELFVSLVPLHTRRLQTQVMKKQQYSVLPGQSRLRSEDCTGVIACPLRFDNRNKAVLISVERFAQQRENCFTTWRGARRAVLSIFCRR